MSLVKWFRKNNKKVMAVVVIVIMLGFVGGSYLSYLGRARSGLHRAVAHFLDGREITNNDLRVASRQLDVLRALRAENVLRAQDMQGIALSELILAEQSGRGGSSAVINHIRRTIAQNQYRISNKAISGLYQRSVPSTAYWLLLKNEAQRAGVRIARVDAGRLLANAIPQLFEGATYGQVFGSLLRQGMSEDEVLTAFADLVAILQYAHLICSNEDVTIRQIMHTASRENETITMEFVKFDSDVFGKPLAEPNEETMIAHFNKYKNFLPSTVSPANPRGFGYKLADRVRLEYLAVKLDEVASIAKPPTHEETEEYYRQNKNLFSVQVPLDPNDRDSEMTSRMQSYTEVVDSITEAMLQNRISSKAQSILQQAMTLTEPNLAGTELTLEQLTSEQFRDKTGDYEAAAEQLRTEHNIPIYTGRTGLLSAVDMQTDELLGRFSVEGFGYYPVNLTQVVFAVDELEASELGPFDAPKPRLYESIGPAEDRYASAPSRPEDRIVVIVRITDAIKSSEPNGIDEKFSTHALILDANQVEDANDVYSVREKVSEDVKRLAALGTTKTKARLFLEMASRTSWETALKTYNELYGEDAKDDPNDPNVFIMDNLMVNRTPTLQLKTLAVQNEGNPAAKFFLNQAGLEQQFTDKLYALVPSDSNTPPVLPVIMEFQPDMSFFCIKDLSVKRLWSEDFDRLKAIRLYREDRTQFQSLALVHFNPDNILKRMKFEFVEDEDEKEQADANVAAEAEAGT